MFPVNLFNRKVEAAAEEDKTAAPPTPGAQDGARDNC